jgi:hypothetical protein
MLVVFIKGSLDLVFAEAEGTFDWAKVSSKAARIVPLMAYTPHQSSQLCD